MAGRTAPINKSAQVVLNGAGAGQVKIGPTTYGDTWHDLIVAVSVSTHVSESVCSIYIGSVSPTNLLDTTETGSTGDRSDVPYPLTPGSELIARWTGGDAGATATLSVFGHHTTGAP